VELRGFEPLTS